MGFILVHLFVFVFPNNIFARDLDLLLLRRCVMFVMAIIYNFWFGYYSGKGGIGRLVFGKRCGISIVGYSRCHPVLSRCETRSASVRSQSAS